MVEMRFPAGRAFALEKAERRIEQPRQVNDA